MKSNKDKYGIIKLEKTNATFKTKQTNIKEVRIIHRGNHIVVEVAYERAEKELKSNNSRYCSLLD